MTPLIEAVKNGHYDVVKALLDKGMPPPHLLYRFLTPFSQVPTLTTRRVKAFRRSTRQTLPSWTFSALPPPKRIPRLSSPNPSTLMIPTSTPPRVTIYPRRALTRTIPTCPFRLFPKAPFLTIPTPHHTPRTTSTPRAGLFQISLHRKLPD